MPDNVDWRALLTEAVAANPKGKAGVASSLGVSRTLVSRAMSQGKSALEPSTKFIDKVIKRFHTIECLITNQTQPIAECRKANEPAPMHNPLAMRLWRACQQCPNRPQVQGEKV